MYRRIHLEHRIRRIGRRILGKRATTGQDDEVGLERYLSTLIRTFEFLPLFPASAGRSLPLRLEAMYVPPMVLCGDGWSSPTRADLESFPQNDSGLSPADASPFGPDPIDVRRVPATDTFVEQPYLVLLGGPGSGKTTFLNYLATTFARAYLEGDTAYLQSRLAGFDQILLPIYLPVKTFSARAFRRGDDAPLSPDLFLDLFTEYLSQSDVTLSQEVLRKEIGDGRCLFLFDGMDEGGAALGGAFVAEAISALRNAYPENRFVVTSRRHGYQDLGGPFGVCTIQELREPERRSLILNWSRALAHARSAAGPSLDVERMAKENAEHLISWIEANPNARALSHNPLLLTAIAVVREVGAATVHRRVDLYRECADLLLGARDVRQSLVDRSTDALPATDLDSAEERKRALESVGLWLEENVGAEFLSQTQLEELLRELYTSRGHSPERTQAIVADLVRFFRERGGILEERRPGAFSFSLRVFQEYFAARAIIHSELDPASYLLARAPDRRWREVVRLAAGHWSTWSASGMVRFVRELLVGLDAADETDRRIEEVTHDRLLLAAECVTEAGTVADRELLREAVARLVRAHDRTRVHRLRQTIAEMLGKLPGGAGGQVLFAGLRSDDDEVVASALRGLGCLPVEFIPDEVVRALHALAVETRRADCAPEREGADRESWASKEIEYHATIDLGHMARVRGQPGRRLQRRLMRDLRGRDSARRQVAARVLAGAVQGPEDELGRELLRVLQSQPGHTMSDRQVRWILCQGLLSAGVGPDRLISVSDLQKMLEDEDWVVRAQAARAAGTVDRAHATPKLLDGLLYCALWDGEREVLSAASTSLGKIASARFCSRNRSGILSALQDYREEVRAAAARVLGRLGRRVLSDQVKRALIARAIQEPSDQVGYAAAKGIARVGPAAIEIGREESRELLRDLLDAACGRAYTDVRGESRLGLYTRSALCIAVSRVGRLLEPCVVAESLIKQVLLTDPLPELRAAAALAVEELGIEMIRDPVLVEALVRTLRERAEAATPQDLDKTESDSTVRAAILRLLAQDAFLYDNPQWLDLIRIYAREDSATEVRVAALRILGRVYVKSKDRADRDALLLACERDPSSVVRSAAYSALFRLEDLEEERTVDVLDSIKARRAIVRANLERLLIDGGTLGPDEASEVIAEIIASLRINFQLQARATEKPAEELQAWVRATDYGLTRMQLETCFEQAVERHISSRGSKRERALARCGDIVQEAIWDRFYVRPKPVGSTLRRNADWRRAQNEIRAFCSYFEREHMIGADYAAAEGRLKNALFCLNRLVSYDLARYPVSYQDPVSREDLASLPKVRDKVKRLCAELDSVEPSPPLARYLLEQIRRTPVWSDL